MDYTHTPTDALLHVLIGEHATTSGYLGSLRPFFEANSEDAAPDLAPFLVARELLRRWIAEEIMDKNAFESPAEVKDYLRLAFAGKDHESFIVLFLDAQHRLIAAEELFRGTLTQTAVYPREIVKRVLQVNASAVVIAHNHPSGVAEPSRADEHLTQSLKATLALVDVHVLDHFVVAGNAVTSFAERGLL